MSGQQRVHCTCLDIQELINWHMKERMPEGTLLGTEGALKFILKFIFQLAVAAEGKP